MSRSSYSGRRPSPDRNALFDYVVGIMPRLMIPRYIEFVPLIRRHRTSASRSQASASSR